jgi:hypothetical protein
MPVRAPLAAPVQRLDIAPHGHLIFLRSQSMAAIVSPVLPKSPVRVTLGIVQILCLSHVNTEMPKTLHQRQTTAVVEAKTICIVARRSPDPQVTCSTRDKDTASCRPPSRLTARQQQARRSLFSFKPT